MPQSLTVGGGSSSFGTSTKRQRSADSREVQTRSVSDGMNRSNGSLSRSSTRIPSYLDKSKAEISGAFQDLEWKQRFRLFHAVENPTTSPFRVERSEVVINRNRYGNVQPWDQLRVKLKTPLNGSDYVNASPIILRSRGVEVGSGENTENSHEKVPQEYKYIATQGPKEATLTHFWRMVMQETTGDTGVIVMLTQCFEANKEKCSQYFPLSMDDPTMILSKETEKGEQTDADNLETIEEDQQTERECKVPQKSPIDAASLRKDLAPSDDTVTLTSMHHDTRIGSQVRIFTLMIDNSSKTIYHYLFTGWPDFGKPEAQDRVALVELARQSRKIAGESPRVVHCSAGVGRTGTFIALDFFVAEIEEGRISDTLPSSNATYQSADDLAPWPSSGASFSDLHTPTTETWGKSGPPKVKTPTSVDFPSGEENHALRDDLIYETVNTLREQRMMMVMNELQYAMLYEVLREVFVDKYKARPEGAVVKPVDLPRAKIPRVVGGDGDGDGGDGDEGATGSVSEAETEIMGSFNADEEPGPGETPVNNGSEVDPYKVVAPEHIREGIAQQQQQQQ